MALNDIYVKRADIEGVIEERIESYLKNTSIPSKLIEISGEYGIGKTCLVKIILKILKKQNYCVIHFDSKRKPIQKDYLCEAVANMLEETGFAIKKDVRGQLSKFKHALPDVYMSIPFIIPEFLRLRFSSKAICELVEALCKGTYLNKLKDATDRNDLYVNKLAQIVFEVCEHTKKNLGKNKETSVPPYFYIVFDDFEDIDTQADELIRKIIYHFTPNIGIVITTSNLVEDMQKNVARKLIYDIRSQFQKNVDFKSEKTPLKPFALKPFEESQVKEYLECRQCDTSNQTIRTAFENSHGLPWLLSILCEEPGFLVSNNPNIKDILRDYCDKVIFSRFSGELDDCKTVIFALAANGGSIDASVFEDFIKKHRFTNTIHALINARIVQEKEGIYEFRIKKLSEALDEIAHSRPGDKLLWRMSQSDLLECYENSPIDISGPYPWYISTIRLMLDLNKSVNDIYKRATEGCDKLISDLQPGYGANVIDWALRDNRLTQKQRIGLQCHKLRALYHSKKLDETIALYDQIYADRENCELCGEHGEKIHYYVAEAHYYKNNPASTIICCNKIAGVADDTPPNLDLFCKTGVLKIAALDLDGKYKECFSVFDTLKHKAKQIDKTADAYFSMVIQMVSDIHSVCITELKRAIEAFSPHEDYTARERACSQNNLGVEYLMQGEKPPEAKKCLMESLRYFRGRLEEHFPLNNLGLYYQYFVVDGRQKARDCFEQAIRNAVSPLQNAYTRMNLAILECQELNWEQGKKLFDQAAEFVDKCPDPLAKSYFSYNYAMYLFKRGQMPQVQEYLKESCEKLQKPQVSNLFDKRQRLATQISCTIPPKICNAIGDRRKFFAEQEWEPCELMFYE
jgi:tetratricopeptide (TPR) repeat protein